jgi:hypothetical protein
MRFFGAGLDIKKKGVLLIKVIGTKKEQTNDCSFFFGKNNVPASGCRR